MDNKNGNSKPIVTNAETDTNAPSRNMKTALDIKQKPCTANPHEKGGPKGPEPTRYGDWEKGGKCVDF